MKLTGGLCSCCSEPTCASVLWAGSSSLLRVWCCDACAARMNEDVRSLLTLAAAELEQRHLERGQSSQPVSTPSA